MDEGDIEDGEILDDEAAGDSENEYHDGDHDQKVRNKTFFKNNLLPDEQKREYGLPDVKSGASAFKSKSSEQTFNGNHGDKSLKEETVAVKKRRSSRVSESSSSDHHTVAKRRSSTTSASLTVVRKKRRRSTERKENVGISDEDDIICISGGSLNNGSRTSFGTEVPNTSSSSSSGSGKKTSSAASRPAAGRKEPLLPDPKIPPGSGNGSFLKSNSDRNYHHDRYHAHQEAGSGRRTNSGRGGKFNSDIGAAASRATALGTGSVGRGPPALIKNKEEPSSGGGGSAGGISQDLCIFFLHGKCNRGSECNFIHALTRPKKLEPCKFYVMDRCNKRDQCVYMHNDFPCKFYHTGSTCYQGKDCKFSHRKLDDLHRKVLWKYLNKNDVVPSSFSSDDRLAPPPLPSKRTTGAMDDPLEDDYMVDGDYRHHSRLPPPITALSRKDAKDSRIPSLFDIRVSIPPSVDKYEDIIANTTPDADYINSDEIDERPFSSSALEDDKPLRNKYKQAPPLLNNNRRYNSRHTHDNFLAGPPAVPVDYHERVPLGGKSSKFPDLDDRNSRRRGDGRASSRRSRSLHGARVESSDFEDNNNGGKYYNSGAEDDHNTPICSPRSLTGFNNDGDDDDDVDIDMGEEDDGPEEEEENVTAATPNDGAELSVGSHRRRSDEEHDRSSNSGRKRSKKKSGKHHHHHHHQMRSDSEEKKYLEREIRKLNRKEQKQRDRQRRKHEMQNYDFPTPEKEQETDEGQWQQRDQSAANNKEEEDDIGQAKMVVQLSEAASHLPKKQQELYRRILQQQKKVNDCGEPLPESETVDNASREEERYTGGATATNEEVDWYSSDEDSSAVTAGVSSLNVILNTIKPATAAPTADKTGSRINLLQPSSNRNSAATESSAPLLNISELSNIHISDEVSKILSSIRQQSAANEVSADSGITSTNTTGSSSGGGNAAPSTESKQCSWIDAGPSSLLAPSEVIAGNEQSPIINMNNLPFKPIPMHDIATEIDASITSHPPMEYKLIPLDPIPKVNYAAMPSSCRLNDLDPRFNRLSVADQSADAPLTPSTGPSSAVATKSSDPRLETATGKHLLINTLSPTTLNPLPVVTNSLPAVVAFQPANNVAIITKKSESELLPPRDPRLSRTAAATTATQLADPRLSAVTSKNAPVPINLNLITQVPPPNLNIPPQINPNVPPLLAAALPMAAVSQNESRIPSALSRPTDPRIRFKSNLSAK